MKIKKRIVVKYELEVKTGLHIGGAKGVYGIGGIDAPVVKDPLTNKPIIPGSSIKGKLRMLLESLTDKEDLINKTFGPRETKKENPLTRIIFRDLMLTKKSITELENVLGEGFYTEVKAENVIDRATGTAVSPRFIERVPAGSVFAGEYVINYLANDQDNEFDDLVKEGFKYLENNYLGGSGSRGYGKVLYKELSRQEL